VLRPVVVLTYAASSQRGSGSAPRSSWLGGTPSGDGRPSWATLDMSAAAGQPRVGLERDHHYRSSSAAEGKVARFREEVALIRALWSEEKVTFRGKFYNIENE